MGLCGTLENIFVFLHCLTEGVNEFAIHPAVEAAICILLEESCDMEIGITSQQPNDYYLVRA